MAYRKIFQSYILLPLKWRQTFQVQYLQHIGYALEKPETESKAISVTLNIIIHMSVHR